MLSCPRCTFENLSCATVCEICFSSLRKRPISPCVEDNLKNTLFDDRERDYSSSSSMGFPIDKSAYCNCEILSPEVDVDNCFQCGKPTKKLKTNVYKCLKCGKVDHFSNECGKFEIGKVTNTINLKNDACDEETSKSPYFPSLVATNGIIDLLLNHYLNELGKSVTDFKLCSPFPHISQLGYEGYQWSCGYRNIQMLCCSLMSIPSVRNTLFRGQGEVPDINGIQSWIETAWKEGFDTEGCEQLGYFLLGTEKWIGATGSSLPSNSTKLQVELRNWVVRYFKKYSSAASSEIQKSNRITLPLYFQHDGHSRTIVGYEVTESNSFKKSADERMLNETKLLVFDPSSNGKSIVNNLKQDNRYWKAQIKRGFHTFKKLAYQIVYVAGDDYLMSSEERELSKIIIGRKSSDDII